MVLFMVLLFKFTYGASLYLGVMSPALNGLLGFNTCQSLGDQYGGPITIS